MRHEYRPVLDADLKLPFKQPGRQNRNEGHCLPDIFEIVRRYPPTNEFASSNALVLFAAMLNVTLIAVEGDGVSMRDAGIGDGIPLPSFSPAIPGRLRGFGGYGLLSSAPPQNPGKGIPSPMSAQS